MSPPASPIYNRAVVQGFQKLSPGARDIHPGGDKSNRAGAKAMPPI